MEKRHRARFRVEFPRANSQHFRSEHAFIYHIIYHVIFANAVEHRFLDACLTKSNRSECVQFRRIFLLIRIGAFNRQIPPVFATVGLDGIFAHKACRLRVDTERNFVRAVEGTINQKPTLFAVLNRILIARVSRQG